MPPLAVLVTAATLPAQSGSLGGPVDALRLAALHVGLSWRGERPGRAVPAGKQRPTPAPSAGAPVTLALRCSHASQANAQDTR